MMLYRSLRLRVVKTFLKCSVVIAKKCFYRWIIVIKLQLRILCQWFTRKTSLTTHHLNFMGRAILLDNPTSRVCLTKILPSDINSSLVITHYTLGVRTCPTFPHSMLIFSSFSNTVIESLNMVSQHGLKHGCKVKLGGRYHGL